LIIIIRRSKKYLSLEKKLEGGKRETQREREGRTKKNTFIILNKIVEHFINHSEFVYHPSLEIEIRTDGAL
jgi:hypothetical protein